MKGVHSAETPMLSGRTVLVVEEEFLIALDLQRMLEAQAAGPALFARSWNEAAALRDRWEELGLAIVEFRTGETQAIELAADLRSAGVPVVICTSDAAQRRGLPALPGVPVVTKPILETDLARAIGLALAP